MIYCIKGARILKESPLPEKTGIAKSYFALEQAKRT